MRPAFLLALLVLIVAVAGCDSGSDSEPGQTESTERRGLRSSEGRLIRDWLQALNRGDYGRAAGFFAPGALVDQGTPRRLRDRTAARIFNATLPCRADLVKLVDEGREALASFSLRAGPGGPCAGVVQVRFRFDVKDRFSEFRQLPGDEDRPGQAI